MKGPLIKQTNNVLWIAAAITGSIAAGVTVWYCIKRATSKSNYDEFAKSGSYR
jgi:hypothetical protein